jgi:hypothetical protein
MWCSIVNDATVSNDPSGHGSSVASAVTTSTLLSGNRVRSACAASGSISIATSERTRERSHSVAAPGPGPISSSSGPSSTSAANGESTSATRWEAHSGLVHTR